MSNEPEKSSKELAFRVFPDEKGEVYLLLMRDEEEINRVPVSRKVIERGLWDARREANRNDPY